MLVMAACTGLEENAEDPHKSRIFEPAKVPFDTASKRSPDRRYEMIADHKSRWIFIKTNPYPRYKMPHPDGRSLMCADPAGNTFNVDVK